MALRPAPVALTQKVRLLVGLFLVRSITMPVEYLYEVDTNPTSMSYIYALVDPRSMHAHYVGMTENPVMRYKQHYSNATKKQYKQEEKQLYLWFQDILRNDMRPRMIILAEVPLEKAKISERHFIGLLRSNGEPIFNRDKSIFEMRAIAKLHDGKCLSNEYSSSIISLNWQCKAEHVFFLSAARVLRGEWCPSCSKLSATQSSQRVKDIYESNRATLRQRLPSVFNLY